MLNMTTLDVAQQAFARHVELHPLTHYTGIVALHGLARLAVNTGNDGLMEHVRAYLCPFVQGECDFGCNFLNYRCGGNASAFLLQQGLFPEASQIVCHYARQLVEESPRDKNGIFCFPKDPAQSKIFIDVAFAVTPFLLFAGLALNEPGWVDESFQQTAKMVEAFRNAQTGLLHQSRGFAGPGKLSEDHWSRGNGWGLLALAELVYYLPSLHPHRPAAEKSFVELINACLRVQDDNGMWHQEMTNHRSYVETSGTGLMLYALGIGLEKGLLPPKLRTDFERGLRAYSRYITTSGDVFHTCCGCLSPGDGSQLAYEAKAPVLNDCHAFGPVILAFGQAWKLGITDIPPTKPSREFA